jgi:hypothetical protein
VEMTDILDKSCVMKVVTGKTFLKWWGEMFDGMNTDNFLRIYYDPEIYFIIIYNFCFIENF